MGDEFEMLVSLAVETSGRAGSVAVARGAAILASEQFNTQLRHGVELLPAVARACAACGVTPGDVAHIYVSGGPGSFTGLRIGITFAKTMALATAARVVRVPTLMVIAQNTRQLPQPPERVAVILDAKRDHVYSAAFRRDGILYEPIDAPAERDPTAYLAALAPIAVVGEGVAYHRAAVESASGVTILPDDLNRARAEVVHELGRRLAAQGGFPPANELTPIYIRRPDAEEKWELRQSSPKP